MRIHVLSDLHLEMRPYLPAQVEADVVVISAGGDEGGLLAIHLLQLLLKHLKNSFLKYNL